MIPKNLAAILVQNPPITEDDEMEAPTICHEITTSRKPKNYTKFPTKVAHGVSVISCPQPREITLKNGHFWLLYFCFVPLTTKNPLMAEITIPMEFSYQICVEFMHDVSLPSTTLPLQISHYL